MRADDRFELLSRYLDGDVSAEESLRVEEMLAHSTSARETMDGLRHLRREMRDADGSAPDVTPAVLRAIREPAPRGPSRRLPAVAAFVAGLVVGAVFIGLDPGAPPPIAAADVPGEVVAAQSRVDALSAQLEVTERGRHPAVPERVYRGTLAFRSPESLTLDLRDLTEYPSDGWVPNDVTHVIDEDSAWASAVADCPTEALPTCTPSQPRVSATVDREPFPRSSIAALDVVVPVGGFVRADTPSLVGFDRRDGREAIGVRVTAAQLAGLIDFFVGHGNWRRVHPTDPVELWLDAETLVPLAFSVYPADNPDRELWAIRHGYVDHPDMPVLEVSWREIEVNGSDPGPFPSPPSGEAPVDAGFADGTADDLDRLAPSDLPAGMTLHRSGIIQVGTGPPVSVATWSDGRAWMKLEWTRAWRGDHLFGDPGRPVREVRADSGVAYVNEAGDRVAIHGSETDAVVTGSLPTGDLVSAAMDLGFSGVAVPDDWEEATSATLAEAREAFEPLLVPDGLDGFGAPAVRLDSDSVTLFFAGAGNRAFVLTQTPDGSLPPPLDADVRQVTVRGGEGRYSPDRGLVEWVEEGSSIGLRSTTLSLEELLSIATSLEAE